LKILLVEDSQDLVNSLRLCFSIRMPEAQLIDTNLGLQGIEMVKSESPDIIILDLGLPDIDGKEVLKSVRAFSQIPIVIFSVRNQESDKSACFQAGATDYITKPFSALALMQRIKEILKQV